MDEIYFLFVAASLSHDRGLFFVVKISLEFPNFLGPKFLNLLKKTGLA